MIDVEKDTANEAEERKKEQEELLARNLERLAALAEEERKAEEEKAKKEAEKSDAAVPLEKEEVGAKVKAASVKAEPHFEQPLDQIDIRKSKNIDKFRLSYIEDYEEEEARRLVEESLGFEPIRVTGWQIAVKVYTRPEDVKEIITDSGKKISIYLPNESRAHDKFVNCVGLVINMGVDCYKDKYFVEPLYMQLIRKVFGKWMKPSTKRPWCKIGDWVVFDRNAGPQINYRDVPVTILEDKHIRAVVECPTHVSRY